METIFPDQPGFSGLYLVGYRRTPPGDGAVQKIGCVIVKRAYRIEDGALVPDAAGERIRVADDFEGPGTSGAVTRESDLALYKPESDLIVMGFNAGDDGGIATVAGETWFQRGALSNDPGDSDTARHLFGWEPRADSDREADAGSFSDDADDYPDEWPVPADPPELPGFRNRFFNAYRRRFKDPPLNELLPRFQPGDEVSITGEGGDTVELTLGPERIRGRVHYWCERGPDRQTHWCELALDEFVADTLVVEPDAGRASLVWRGVWPLDGAGEPPSSSYRRLVVTPEEA